jgi:N-acetylglucosamine-6-phosphate deacetylase
MILKNVRVYHSDNPDNPDNRKFVNADIVIEDGKFADINYSDSSDNDNQNNMNSQEVIIPGFVDIHSHGGVGVDIFTADCEELVKMSEYYAQNGVTTLFPTTMSDSHEKIMRMIEEVKKAKKLAKTDFAGIHLEGPYLNKAKRGAHALHSIKNAIKDADLNELEEICAAVLDCGLKLHVTLAPEIHGGLETVKFLNKRGATVTLGHTEADAETINQAIGLGAVSFTHLFNAMTGIHHRDAGVAGNAINSPVYVELICDGIHICPEIVSLTARANNIDRIVIVSDSMSAAGLAEGEYNLGQSAVTIKDGKVVLKGTDTIAGSTANLCGELNNFMKFTGINFEDALLTVTKNPAECVGLYDTKGGIAKGKDADFIIWRDGGIKQVYVKGERAF